MQRPGASVQRHREGRGTRYVPEDAGPSIDAAMPTAYADMRPLKKTLEPSAAQELREKRRVERVREEKVAAVQAEVATQKAAARGSLYDSQDFMRSHDTRNHRMETTFTRLYQPQSKAYWTQARNERRPKGPPPGAGMLPAYVDDLPRALSLSHPATREEPEDDEPEPAEVKPAAPVEVFDPMAVPDAFYRKFKQRVAALRADVAVPPPEATDVWPRKAEEVRPRPSRRSCAVALPGSQRMLSRSHALTQPASPAQPPPAPVQHLAAALADEPVPQPKHEAPALASEPEAPSWDADRDLEPSLVYTDTTQYLSGYGVTLPSWDEAIDEQIEALNRAHMAAIEAEAAGFEDGADAPSSLLEGLELPSSKRAPIAAAVVKG